MVTIVLIDYVRNVFVITARNYVLNLNAYLALFIIESFLENMFFDSHIQYLVYSTLLKSWFEADISWELFSKTINLYIIHLLLISN